MRGATNLDEETVAGFGHEWSQFTYADASRGELEGMFADYFELFPWHALPANATGFDLGCGTGRWARFVAPRVGHLECIDASPSALVVARENLKHCANVRFFNASVDEMPIADATMDFGYALGVLHHVPDTLYYAFDNRAGLGLEVFSIPLAYYRKKTFYTMRTDALERCGLERIQFRNVAPFWTAVAYRRHR